MPNWNDKKTSVSWADYFCDNPDYSLPEEKNLFFMNNFIGDSKRIRNTIRLLLGNDPALITQYRLITGFLLKNMPDAAFNVPGYSWNYKPLLAAGKIGNSAGSFNGPRIVLIYENIGENQGFYYCANQRVREIYSPTYPNVPGCCDRGEKYFRLGGVANINQQDGIITGILHGINNIIITETHNPEFITDLLRYAPESPIYPKLINDVKNKRRFGV